MSAAEEKPPDSRPSPTPPQPKPTPSGEHAAVKAFRDKMESVRDNQLAELEDINRRLLRLKTPIPPAIPRADGDEEIPVDVVEELKP